MTDLFHGANLEMKTGDLQMKSAVSEFPKNQTLKVQALDCARKLATNCHVRRLVETYFSHVRRPVLYPAELRARCAAGLRRSAPQNSWSGREDLNLRPSAPKADALPDCATPRPARILTATLRGATQWSFAPAAARAGSLITTGRLNHHRRTLDFERSCERILP